MSVAEPDESSTNRQIMELRRLRSQVQFASSILVLNAVIAVISLTREAAVVWVPITLVVVGVLAFMSEPRRRR